MYARASAPGAWQKAILDGVEAPVAKTGFHPALVLDGAGGLHVLYREMNQNCLAYVRNLGAGWEKPACASVKGNGGLYATGVFDGAGKLHVAYDSGWEIFYGACEGCGGP
jgi:hypothetical protein